ncbi:unnamed protein product [Allacma fusca]|uniref:CRAL-TRIO domain-containing protein n=1 Tax=Allacma fusca TaxID=39272 RepID=A0A8J2L1N6_9HEXA|nr:unnamed protein product [Allacma fusca]
MSKNKIFINGSEKEITKVEAAIKKLRDAVEDLVTNDNHDYEDDYNLLRWLRAQNMNVKKAEKMLRNAHAWKHENNVEQLVYEDLPIDMIEQFPIYVDGMSENGTPVASVQAGKVDFAGQLKLMGKERVLRYCIQIFAQGEKFILECNRKSTSNEPLHENSFKGAIAIVDFDRFSYSQIRSIEAIRTSIEVCKIMMNYFPDLGSEMYCINCNSVSRAALRILRPILETQNLTFQVFGTNELEWKEAILSKIPAHQIRPPFGGTRLDKQILVKPEYLIRSSS